MPDCRSIRSVILIRNRLIERVLLNLVVTSAVLQNDKFTSLECSSSNGGGANYGEKLI